jgi:hypothetical protein
MSTQEQLKGDSLRRQLEQSRDYAAKNGMTLVEDLRDIGIALIFFVGGHSGTLGTEPPLTYFGLPLTVCLVADSRRSFKSGHL